MNAALACDPINFEAGHFRKAVAAAPRPDLDAEYQARTALALQVQVPELRDTIGGILARYGKHAEAWRFFEEAVVLNPEDSTALWPLALGNAERNSLGETGHCAQLSALRAWLPEVLAHAGHAFTRGRITSASGARVTEPLHQRARDRWRHDTEHPDDCLGRLRRCCKKLGYDI